jgi:hypothetical protein
MSKQSAIAFFSSLLICVFSAAAQASPLIGIGDCAGCQSWQSAIDSGNLQPVFSLTGEEFESYEDSLGSTNFALSSNIELFANPNVLDDFATSRDALVMSWDSELGTDLTIAAWEYVYDVDPDLTGTMIHFSALAPPGIWDLSIELIDINGRVRGWFVDGTTLVNGVWTNHWLDPSNPFAAGFIPGPIQDPLFDLTQVVKIRLDEAGMTTAIFAPPPVGGTIVGQWNAWDHLQVVPEPTTAMLLGLGLCLQLLARARRRSAR